jgi:hypothetical protein
MKSLVMAVVLFAGPAFGAETKISESEVPQPVLDAVAKKYPAAKRVGFEREVEHGKTVYEVKVLVGARKIDLDVSADGKLTSEEEELAYDAVPTAVRTTLSASPKYGTWTVKKAEKVVHAERPDAPEYELAVTNGRSKAELVFAADGKLLRTED